MKILIFRDENTLIDHLDSYGEPVSILDFTGSRKVREIAPDVVISRATFTPQQKERIRDEYIEIISDIGALNHFSIHWLCHPMSEKNDLAPDNLFDRLVNFLSFYHTFSKVKKETLAVLPHSESLVQSIMDFSAENGINCQVVGKRPAKPELVRKVGSWGKRLIYLLKGVLRTQYWYLKSGFLWRKLDKTKTYTVIRTWFDSRSRGLMENTKDIYFGKLPGFLKDQGKHILYFGDFVYGFEHEFHHLKKIESPLVLGRSRLHGLDFFKAFLFQYSVKHNIHLKPGVKILDINVDIVFRNFSRDYARHQQVQVNYLSYLAVVKLTEKIKVDIFYMPFENYAWEKLTWLVLSRHPLKINIVAFQHAQVALNATKFFLGQKESQDFLFPDKLVTLGEVTQEALIKRCNYPAQKLVTGCALRQDYPIASNPAARIRHKRVLVQLWTVEKSVRMINFLHASGIHPDKYQVTINPHPCNPLEVLIPLLDFKYDNHFHLATGSLTENFKRHDLVIYHGTTTCLDALANGLPVIEVEFDDFITVDPLFQFNDFKWTARKPRELAETIEVVYALSDEEYYQRQQKGFEFVKKYFYPVNEENLKKFLI
jgi:hypothetical protein